MYMYMYDVLIEAETYYVHVEKISSADKAISSGSLVSGQHMHVGGRYRALIIE